MRKTQNSRRNLLPLCSVHPFMLQVMGMGITAGRHRLDMSFREWTFGLVHARSMNLAATGFLIQPRLGSTTSGLGFDSATSGLLNRATGFLLMGFLHYLGTLGVIFQLVGIMLRSNSAALALFLMSISHHNPP